MNKDAQPEVVHVTAYRLICLDCDWKTDDEVAHPLIMRFSMEAITEARRTHDNTHRVNVEINPDLGDA